MRVRPRGNVPRFILAHRYTVYVWFFNNHSVVYHRVEQLTTTVVTQDMEPSLPMQGFFNLVYPLILGGR